MGILREYIRDLLTEARYVTMVSPLKSDLEQAIYWLQNNKKVRTRGAIHQDGDLYLVRIRPKGDRKDIKSLINDRFGNFVRVK